MAGMLASRRCFLGGAGVVVGLPFLESALPRRAWGQAAPSIQRFMATFFPNGIDKRGWAAQASGRNAPAGNNWATIAQSGGPADILEPLTRNAGVRGKTMILDGLHNGGGGAGHGEAWSAIMNGAAVKMTGPTISVDQMIANHLAGQTRIRSLELGIYSGNRPISYSGTNQEAPPEGNPRNVFDRVFAGFDPDQTDVERLRRQTYETSILDHVIADLDTLKARLGRNDRLTLDAYTDSIRQLESEISTSSAGCAPTATPPGQSSGGDDGYPQTLKWMMDLAVAAFACDATRVITLVSNTDGNGHPWVNAPENHHELSHWGGNTANRDKVRRIDAWQMERYAEDLLIPLESIDEGGGRTILDSAYMHWTTEIEEGDSHAHTYIPVVMSGSAGGKLNNTGQYIRFRQARTGTSPHDNGQVAYIDDNESTGNLYITVMQAFGMNVATFGAAGDRPLAQLLA